jgi:hypothetical protein
MKTKFESIQEIREDGFPKVKEITAKEILSLNPKDPNYDLPWSNLEKEY